MRLNCLLWLSIRTVSARRGYTNRYTQRMILWKTDCNYDQILLSSDLLLRFRWVSRCSRTFIDLGHFYRTKIYVSRKNTTKQEQKVIKDKRLPMQTIYKS